MFLAVPPELADSAILRWRELGGTSAAMLPRVANSQLTFIVRDQDSADGKALTTLSQELGTKPDGPALLSLSAVYDQSDISQAEILFLEEGALDDVVDPHSIVPSTECAKCGRYTKVRARDTNVRLVGEVASQFDYFNSEMLKFVSKPLSELLSGFRGIVLTPTIVPENVEPFSEVSASASLGYPVNGITWGPPCDVCGLRRGSVTGLNIINKHVYPRRAWDGSDVMTSALYPNGLFVTQSFWKIISDSRWRIPDPGVVATPVQLVDGAEPIS
jgi:hypothetical protein